MSVIVGDGIFRLFGKVQNYSWGGYHFIPSLIGFRPEAHTPYAEYWLGAHEKAPSEIDTSLLLSDIIKEQPEVVLGSHTAKNYGRLPFLFKVLDVREMLSIQVHPTKSDAEAGFLLENEMGIPLDASERNYKDDNHKPEIQVALSEFWLLHGFRPERQLYQVLDQIPEFSVLKSVFVHGGYRELYKHVMTMPDKSVNALLHPLVVRILQKYDAGELEKTSPDYWAAKAIREIQTDGYDRGIFSIYFFNLVRLKPGQASFQDAGIPHALLNGQAFEIMANSDNVIRGGLTPKHMDIAQLLKLMTFRGMSEDIIAEKESDHPSEILYESPNPDFGLSRVQLCKGAFYTRLTTSAEILFVLEGEARLHSAGSEVYLKRGESAFVFAEKDYQIQGASENVLVFRAFVPNIS